MDCYILHTALLVILILPVIAIIFLDINKKSIDINKKYRSKQKKRIAVLKI